MIDNGSSHAGSPGAAAGGQLISRILDDRSSHAGSPGAAAGGQLISRILDDGSSHAGSPGAADITTTTATINCSPDLPRNVTQILLLLLLLLLVLLNYLGMLLN